MRGAAALVVRSDAISFAPIAALSRASIVMEHDVYRRARAASQVKQVKCPTSARARDALLAKSWRAGRNKTANTYVIEIAL